MKCWKVNILVNKQGIKSDKALVASILMTVHFFCILILCSFHFCITFLQVFKYDTGHCIAPVDSYIMPPKSIPLCTDSCVTFCFSSPSLQSPYKMLQFAGQLSIAIFLPTVVIWASFSTGILLLPAVSERKNGCDPYDTK